MNTLPKIYLPPPFPGRPIVPVFYKYFETHFKESRHLFMDERLGAYEYRFEAVEAPEQADFFMVPNSFKRIGAEEASYLERYQNMADALQKPLVLCIFGDLTQHVAWSRGIVLRNSQYRFLHQKNELMVPAFAEDLLVSRELHIRKKSAKPVISFCGFAAVHGARAIVRFHLKNLYWESAALLIGKAEYRTFKQGIYFRRKAMAVLAASPLVDSRFIIRDFFSSHQDTAKLPADVLRREFIDNMENSDFVLAPKGDGNYSNRFYEALSVGRIPVLIDTATVLPHEDSIDYSAAVLRIPYEKIGNLPETISGFYQALSEDAFMRMQREARRLFAEELRYDSFFNRLFLRLAEPTYVQSLKTDT